jgi:hypothetical protein
MVKCVQFKFYENKIIFQKNVKNAQNFLSYFLRFHFGASLSVDFGPYSTKKTIDIFITLEHPDSQDFRPSLELLRKRIASKMIVRFC